MYINVENLKTILDNEIIKEHFLHLSKWVPTLKGIEIPNNISFEEWAENLNNFNKNNHTKIACLIMVKNQQLKVIKSINSILHLVDECIVVDTGSTDNTIQNIKELKSNKITVHKMEWIEDFAVMRNKTLNLVTSDWVIVLDSDEVFTSEINYDEFHSILNILDYCEFKDIALQVEAHYSNTSRFVLPDRIFRNTKSIYYHGIIHEEILSKKEIIKLQSIFRVENYGVDKKEIKKFNKKERYSSSLYKMIKLEPENPRWIALSDSETIEKALDDKYENILVTHLLNNVNQPFQEQNIQSHEYVRPLIEKYIVYLIQIKDIPKAFKVIELAKKLYPKNINFIFYEYALKKGKIEVKLRNLLKEYLAECNNIPDDYYIDSQKDDQILIALTVSFFKTLGMNYQDLIKRISDPMVKEFLLMDDITTIL